jgi:RNA 2',3'-cyclic 3'-phosphodiesterase
MKRIFIAIDVSEECRQAAADHIAKLRTTFPRVRVGWERPEKLHVTLKFLGETTEKELEDVTAQLDRIAQNYEPFEMEAIGAAVFPRPSQAKVLWLGVTVPREAERLAGEIEASCAGLGFRPERRRFAPHLTIARLREPQSSGELVTAHLRSAFGPVRFRTGGITIYESKLQPTGSIYSKLLTIPFRKDPRPLPT